MSKFATLILGVSYHAEGILFTRGEARKVTDEQAEILATHGETDAELLGHTYVSTFNPRFKFEDREEVLEDVLVETADVVEDETVVEAEVKEEVKTPAKRGRKPTLLEQVEEELTKS